MEEYKGSPAVDHRKARRDFPDLALALRSGYAVSGLVLVSGYYFPTYMGDELAALGVAERGHRRKRSLASGCAEDSAVPGLRARVSIKGAAAGRRLVDGTPVTG
jgi:hypothetical protein